MITTMKFISVVLSMVAASELSAQVDVCDGGICSPVPGPRLLQMGQVLQPTKSGQESLLHVHVESTDEASQTVSEKATWPWDRRRDTSRRRNPPGWHGSCFSSVRRRNKWRSHEGMAIHVYADGNCGGNSYESYSDPPAWRHQRRRGRRCSQESTCNDDAAAWGTFKDPVSYPTGKGCGEYFSHAAERYTEKSSDRRRMSGRMSSFVIILDYSKAHVRDSLWCVKFYSQEYFRGVEYQACCGNEPSSGSRGPVGCQFTGVGNFNDQARSYRMFRDHRRRTARERETNVGSAGSSMPMSRYTDGTQHAQACGYALNCMNNVNNEMKKDLADHGSALSQCLVNVGAGATSPGMGAVMGAKGMAENCFDCRGRGSAFKNVHETQANLNCAGAIICTAVGFIPIIGTIAGAACGAADCARNFYQSATGHNCVAQDTLLNVNGVTKAVGQLQPGDVVEVLTTMIEDHFMGGPYERRNGTFLGWAAKYDNSRQDMVKVEVGERSIVLTDQHYLLGEDGLLVPADELEVGQSILVNGADGVTEQIITSVMVLPANVSIPVAMPLVVSGLTDGHPTPGDLILTASGIALPLYNQVFADLSPSQSHGIFETWLQRWASLGESDTSCLVHMDHAHHASLIVEVLASYTSRHHAGLLDEDELDVDKFLCYVVTHKNDEFKFEDLDHIPACQALNTKYKDCKSDDGLIKDLDESVLVYNDIDLPHHVIDENATLPDPEFKTMAVPCDNDGEGLLPGDANISTFRCLSGECIAIKGLCNFFANCVDVSDENNC